MVVKGQFALLGHFFHLFFIPFDKTGKTVVGICFAYIYIPSSTKSFNIDFAVIECYNEYAKQTKYCNDGCFLFRDTISFIKHTITDEFDKMQIPYSDSIVIYPSVFSLFGDD